MPIQYIRKPYQAGNEKSVSRKKPVMGRINASTTNISEKGPTPTNIYWGRVGGRTKKHLRGTIPSAKSIVFKKTNIF